MVSWKFKQTFPAERRDRLLRSTEFADVVQLICKSARIACVRGKPGKSPGLTECIQPVFDIEVCPEAYDAFFNSPGGYRAQYLRDPLAGIAANHDMIGALLERLMDEARKSNVDKLRDVDVRSSLKAQSCKIWIHEETFNFDTPSQDLDVATWAEQAFQGEEKARWGLCAPSGTRLQVKGALLNPHGHEIVPCKKILRHEDIHMFGFT